MADVEVLKNLVDQQIKENFVAREEAKLERDQAIADRDEANRRHNELLAEMQLQRAAHVVPALPGDAGGRAAAPVVTRAEKISRMQLNLRKSNKLKEFKESTETGAVKEWLSRFETEIKTLKKMAGIADDLSRDEMIELFQDRIEYQVLKRLDTAFAAKDPPWQWTTVTYDQLKTIMKQEYGSRETKCV